MYSIMLAINQFFEYRGLGTKIHKRSTTAMDEDIMNGYVMCMRQDVVIASAHAT
jgi:hypothetical protein